MFGWIKQTATQEFPARRWILYVFCFVTVSMASGVVYGWPALRRQLQEDGSTLEESTLGAIFTVGAWSTQGGRFFVGLARDRFGTRSVTSFCIFLVAVGFLGVAWSDPNSAMALGISLFFVGLGSGAQLCVQPVAGLFPLTSGTIIASLSGAFQISGLVFLALASGNNVDKRNIRFSSFALLLVAISLCAMVLLPEGKSFLLENEEFLKGNHKGSNETNESTRDNKLTNVQATSQNGDSTSMTDPRHDDIGAMDGLEEDNKSNTCVECSNQVLDNEAQHVSDSLSETDCSGPSPTAIEQMKSFEYVFLCIWFSICLTPLQYYVGSIGFQLEEKGDDDGFYTNMFSIIYASSTVFSFAGGFLSDKCGLGITQGLATVMCAGSFFFLVSDISLQGQLVGLALYGVGRLLIFGMYFANCGRRFGYINFGTLAGLGLLISALASLLQYPMISATANGKSRLVNIGSGVALLSQIPYFVWLHRRENLSQGKTSVRG